MPKETKERRTTSIRPPSLQRLNIVLPFLPEKDRNVTDFISDAVDRQVIPLIVQHNIQLPKECALPIPAGSSAIEHKRTKKHK